MRQAGLVTRSFFLGPAGRWTPSDWTDLEKAVADGTLNETSWVELKKALPPSSRPSNLELARDLASLALRSGLLVIGVGEDTPGVPGELSGVDLAATRSRVDQVARNVPTPPIYVDIVEIENPGMLGQGVLLVHVPASGPHMVDGRYWRRGDRGKAFMPDAEVREHFARTRSEGDDVVGQVRALATAIPRLDGQESARRLYVRLVPVDAPRAALTDSLAGGDGRARIDAMVQEVIRARPGRDGDSKLRHVPYWGPYAHGRSLGSVDPSTGEGRWQTVLRLEDGGAADFVVGNVGDRAAGGVGGEGLPAVATHEVLFGVHDVVGVAGRIGEQHAAYHGRWLVASRVDLLEGCYDWFMASNFRFDDPPAYVGGSDYVEVTETTTREMVDEPWAVTSRLLARFVRAIGGEQVYLPFEPGSPAHAYTQ